MARPKGRSPNFSKNPRRRLNKVRMAHLDEETSNALFDTLAEWNQVLNAEALKGDTEPRP